MITRDTVLRINAFAAKFANDPWFKTLSLAEAWRLAAMARTSDALMRALGYAEGYSSMAEIANDYLRVEARDRELARDYTRAREIGAASCRAAADIYQAALTSEGVDRSYLLCTTLDRLTNAFNALAAEAKG